VTQYGYDNANRLTKVTLPNAAGSTQYYVEPGYDANGNILCTSLPVATDQSCSSVPDSSKTTMDYFDPGWIERSDDAGTAVVTVQGTYDWLDRVTKARAKKSTDTNWKATLFTYDLDSNVASREDNRVEDDGGNQVTGGRKYTFTYDGADWLTSQTDDRGTPGN